MIDDLIKVALQELNITIEYQETDTYDTTYIIYSIYDEREKNNYDNENETELIYITLNLWCKDKQDLKIRKEIKSLMCKSGFYFDGGKSLKKSDNYYGYTLDFILEKNIE